MQIKDNAFIRLQREMVRQLTLMRNNRAIALSVLSQHATENLALSSVLRMVRISYRLNFLYP
jgi:hypothetical protein